MVCSETLITMGNGKVQIFAQLEMLTYAHASAKNKSHNVNNERIISLGHLYYRHG